MVATTTNNDENSEVEHRRRRVVVHDRDRWPGQTRSDARESRERPAREHGAPVASGTDSGQHHDRGDGHDRPDQKRQGPVGERAQHDEATGHPHGRTHEQRPQTGAVEVGPFDDDVANRDDQRHQQQRTRCEVGVDGDEHRTRDQTETDTGAALSDRPDRRDHSHDDQFLDAQASNPPRADAR